MESTRRLLDIPKCGVRRQGFMTGYSYINRKILKISDLFIFCLFMCKPLHCEHLRGITQRNIFIYVLKMIQGFLIYS